MFGGQIDLSTLHIFLMFNFEPYFPIIDSHTRVYAFFIDMGRSKEIVIQGGCRAAQEFTIAPNWAEQ